MLCSLMRTARSLCAEFWEARATALYAFALTTTTVTMQSVSPRVAGQVILGASTNLHNMADHPVRALITSAFVLQGSWGSWIKAAVCVLTMVPAERWLGSLRWTAVFTAGHVGATLVTVAGIAWGIHHGLLPASMARTVDVGMSYGVAAIAGVLTYWWAHPLARLAWAGFWLIHLGHDTVLDPTFSGCGHLFALLIGFLAHPLTPGARNAQRGSAQREGAPAG